jgi:DNA-binding transcriptional LysR family regulator
MNGEVGGSLLVGASTTIAEFLLPRVMGEFKSKYPNVRPRLIVANSETIETRVAEHTLDIGFIESPSHQPNLQTEVCCEDELQVICSPRFPLARLKEIPPGQLAEHPFVSREPGSGTREFTEVYLQKHGIDTDQMQPVMELGSPVALFEVVETGLGYTIASRTSVMKSLRLGDLVSIPLKPRLTRKLSMVYPKEKFRSRLVTAFVDFATAKLREAKSG